MKSVKVYDVTGSFGLYYDSIFQQVNTQYYLNSIILLVYLALGKHLFLSISFMMSEKQSVTLPMEKVCFTMIENVLNIFV